MASVGVCVCPLAALSFRNRQEEEKASTPPHTHTQTKAVDNGGTNLIKFNLTFVQLKLAARHFISFFPQVDATYNVCWPAMQMRREKTLIYRTDSDASTNAT